MIQYADLIGVPFKNLGRDYHTGLDCYGLVMEVYRRFGIALPEFYANHNDNDCISHIIHEQVSGNAWIPVKPPYPVPCVLAIRFGVSAPLVNHTGVYIGGGKFIHTRGKTGVVIENIHSIAWKRVITGFFVYAGMQDVTKDGMMKE